MRIDVEARELCSLLERAVGSPGRVHEPYATVMFTHGVIAAQRVSTWVENGTVVLGSWVGELQPQYRHFYGNSAVVQDLLALAENGWQVRPNLHLAYHRCPPQRRWYPRMTVGAADYAHYWTHDCRPQDANPAPTSPTRCSRSGWSTTGLSPRRNCPDCGIGWPGTPGRRSTSVRAWPSSGVGLRATPLCRRCALPSGSFSLRSENLPYRNVRHRTGFGGADMFRQVGGCVGGSRRAGARLARVARSISLSGPVATSKT